MGIWIKSLLIKILINFNKKTNKSDYNSIRKTHQLPLGKWSDRFNLMETGLLLGLAKVEENLGGGCLSVLRSSYNNLPETDRAARRRLSDAIRRESNWTLEGGQF